MHMDKKEAAVWVEEHGRTCDAAVSCLQSVSSECESRCPGGKATTIPCEACGANQEGWT